MMCVCMLTIPEEDGGVGGMYCSLGVLDFFISIFDCLIEGFSGEGLVFAGFECGTGLLDVIYEVEMQQKKGALFINTVLPVSLLLPTPTPRITTSLYKCIITQPIGVNWRLPWPLTMLKLKIMGIMLVKMCMEFSWGRRTKEEILLMKVAVEGCSWGEKTSL